MLWWWGLCVHELALLVALAHVWVVVSLVWLICGLHHSTTKVVLAMGKGALVTESAHASLHERPAQAGFEASVVHNAPPVVPLHHHGAIEHVVPTKLWSRAQLLGAVGEVAAVTVWAWARVVGHEVAHLGLGKHAMMAARRHHLSGGTKISLAMGKGALVTIGACALLEATAETRLVQGSVWAAGWKTVAWALAKAIALISLLLLSWDRSISGLLGEISWDLLGNCVLVHYAFLVFFSC